MPSPLPIINVMPRIEFPATTDPEHPTEPMVGAPFDRAFMQDWDTEACFVSYGLSNGGAIPRMRMEALPRLRASGGDLSTFIFAFDYDNPHAKDAAGNYLLDSAGKKYHAPWTPETISAFLNHFFGHVVHVAPWIGKHLAGFYTTRGGARLIYILEMPLPVDKAKAIHKALVVLMAQAGLTWEFGALDAGCSDWTRIMRLPRVMRDGVMGFPIEEYWNLDARLNPADLLGPGCMNLPTDAPSPAALKIDQPTPERVHQIIGQSEKPEWYKSALKDMKGSMAYSTLFEFRPLAPEGARNKTIHAYVGDIVRIMHRYQRLNMHHVQPEDVYALFYTPVQSLGQDEDHLAACWRAVCICWAKEDAKEEENKAKDALLSIETHSVQDTIIKSMRTWTTSRDLEAADSTAATWVAQKMIAATPSGYHVMNRQGFYDARIVSASRLIPLVRELGMEGVIPLGYMTDKEKWKPYTPQNLVDRHATIVNEVEGTASGPGNWIRDLGKPDATMVLKLYSRRTDIHARFWPEVADWLRMVGSGTPDGFEKLTRWISYALAFDEGPTAALAITGVPGFGKKLLVQGLGETITSLRTVDAQEASGFQSALMRSPYFIANEGFPVGGHRGYTPADTFRRLTGGDIVKAEKKFRDVVDIRVPIRVVLCANNLNIVKAIAGNSGELSVDDKHAIAQRLVHLRVPLRAAAWLEVQGGPQHTAGWIAGDGGQASHNKIAEHFLFLYENREKVPRGQRFMMMGDLDSRVIQGFNTQIGMNPIVLEAVAGMLERLAPAGSSIPGAVLLREPGKPMEFWVTEHGVMSWLQVNSPRAADRMQLAQIGRSIRGNLQPGSPEDGEIRTFQTARGEEEACWFRVNMRIVVDDAISHGWPCQQSKGALQESESVMGQIIKPAFPGGA